MDGLSIAKNRTCRKIDPTNPHATGQNEIYVQLVLSLALGISAFFAFCVGLPRLRQVCRVLTATVSSSAMEEPICCTEEADRICKRFA